jgi:prolipoprotein diacylglyceryltransferase
VETPFRETTWPKETIPILSLLRYLDIGAPVLLVGQALGRWGNFANQELWPADDAALGHSD